MKIISAILLFCFMVAIMMGVWIAEFQHEAQFGTDVPSILPQVGLGIAYLLALGWSLFYSRALSLPLKIVFFVCFPLGLALMAQGIGYWIAGYYYIANLSSTTHPHDMGFGIVIGLIGDGIIPLVVGFFILVFSLMAWPKVFSSEPKIIDEDEYEE